MRSSKIAIIALSLASVTSISSCKKDKNENIITEAPATTIATPPPSSATCPPTTSFTAAAGPNLIFKFKFDSTQVRLNNLGQLSTIDAGNAAQSPRFNSISQNYIELAGDFDALGGGAVVYVGEKTTAGGDEAIDYCGSTITGENEVFFAKPLSEINPGSYEWLRVSLAYQNCDITFKAAAIPGNQLATGTIASFLGFNTYINTYDINGSAYSPSTEAGGAGNHKQGYWAFETSVSGQTFFADGQAPAGATTVPNPLFASSPVPQGSCIVTGEFVNNSLNNTPLIIYGTETQDIVITVSVSTNKSFEWIDVVADGYFQPERGETLVDMGVRGMIPIID